MIEPPDKNLSDKKFTLWVIVILVFLVFQFVLTMTGHRELDASIGNVVTVAESARQCPTPQTTNFMLSP